MTDCPAPIIIGVVQHVEDADTITLATPCGPVSVRIAGIEANERHGGCHVAQCPPLGFDAARAVAVRMVYRRTLRCVRVGVSYRRVVASCTIEGRDLGCALIASGAAADWPAFRVKYGLRECNS